MSAGRPDLHAPQKTGTSAFHLLQNRKIRDARLVFHERILLSRRGVMKKRKEKSDSFVEKIIGYAYLVLFFRGRKHLPCVPLWGIVGLRRIFQSRRYAVRLFVLGPECSP